MPDDYDLSIDFCGIRMPYPWMNASGIWSNVPVLEKNQRLLGAAVTKSVGLEPREGNQTPIICTVSDAATINAVGLPNAGYKHLKEELEMSEIAIPVFVSLFGHQPEELKKMIEYLDNCPKISGYELNYSCPNILPGESTGITIGKDPKLTEEYTKSARQATQKTLIVKHSPAPYIFDQGLFNEIIHAAEEGGCDAHAAINTVPGGMAIDINTGRPVLSAGRGGVSGRGIKPIGVGCVRMIHENSKKPIIGMGGIYDADDVAEYMMAGASAVAIGTALGDEYTLINLPAGMRRFMKEHDIHKVSELTGWGYER